MLPTNDHIEFGKESTFFSDKNSFINSVHLVLRYSSCLDLELDKTTQIDIIKYGKYIIRPKLTLFINTVKTKMPITLWTMVMFDYMRNRYPKPTFTIEFLITKNYIYQLSVQNFITTLLSKLSNKEMS